MQLNGLKDFNLESDERGKLRDEMLKQELSKRTRFNFGLPELPLPTTLKDKLKRFNELQCKFESLEPCQPPCAFGPAPLKAYYVKRPWARKLKSTGFKR